MPGEKGGGIMLVQRPSSTINSPVSRQLQTELAAQQRSLDELQALLRKFEQHQRNLKNIKIQNRGDLNQMDQLKLQDAMNKQQQAMQAISNILKTNHDTAAAIINNLK